jgi:hypothetical protein
MKEADGGRPAHATMANHHRTPPRPATHAHPTAYRTGSRPNLAENCRLRLHQQTPAGAPSGCRSGAGRAAGNGEGASPAELQARAGRLPAEMQGRPGGIGAPVEPHRRSRCRDENEILFFLLWEAEATCTRPFCRCPSEAAALVQACGCSCGDSRWPSPCVLCGVRRRSMLSCRAVLHYIPAKFVFHLAATTISDGGCMERDGLRIITSTLQGRGHVAESKIP